MKIITTIGILLVLLFSTPFAHADSGTLERCDDIKHCKEVLTEYIGIFKEEHIDINSDGVEDVLIYRTGGEETYLTLLVKENTQYVVVYVPEGIEYEILKSNNDYEIKVGVPTFPMFGDIHGSDKYHWYDFYRIAGYSLHLNNKQHKIFYKSMIPLYEKRITELEQEIHNLLQQVMSTDDVQSLMIQLRNDHIDRYRNFISKARNLIVD